MNAHLKAIKKKHEALGDIARADLETYLNNQVIKFNTSRTRQNINRSLKKQKALPIWQGFQ